MFAIYIYMARRKKELDLLTHISKKSRGASDKAFRRMNLEKPFYGKQAGMTNEEWWEEVSRFSFFPSLHLSLSTSKLLKSSHIPSSPNISQKDK